MGASDQRRPIQIRILEEQKLYVAQPRQPDETVAGSMYGEEEHLVLRGQNVRDNSPGCTICACSRYELFGSYLNAKAVGEPEMKFDNRRARPAQNNVIVILPKKAGV